jgi:hypothetical protein
MSYVEIDAEQPGKFSMICTDSPVVVGEVKACFHRIAKIVRAITEAEAIANHVETVAHCKRLLPGMTLYWAEVKFIHPERN